jgi:ubiquinone/menaquinone biosynthesis C-methylase UbiE
MHGRGLKTSLFCGWSAVCLCLLLSRVAMAQSFATQNKTGLQIIVAPRDEKNLPEPLTHYQGREIAQTMHYTGANWLMRESREREEDCATLLRVLKIRPGQKICDLGCGNGFYSVPIAERVGKQGAVYAVDIQREMLELLIDRANAEKLTWIRPVLGTPTNPNLPTGELDMVLMVDVYHELNYPEEIVRAVHKSLSAHGRLVLVEFRLEDPRVPIKLLHKMSKEQIFREIRPLGFDVAEEFDGLPWQHVVVFEKTK